MDSSMNDNQLVVPVIESNKKTNENIKIKKITENLILLCSKQSRYTNESIDKYFNRLTHLHMQSKKISLICQLELCPNLKVLYLYDNCIQRIENIEILEKLELLYLNSNEIKEIPDSLKLLELRKLHLEENEISIIKGLHLCEKLSELYISDQRLPLGVSLDFDTECLQYLSKTLFILDVSNNNIEYLYPLLILRNLQNFKAENNKIHDMNEIETFLSTMLNLSHVSFIGNPITHHRDYRTKLITMVSNDVEILDNIPIDKVQQQSLKSFFQFKLRR